VPAWTGVVPVVTGAPPHAAAIHSEALTQTMRLHRELVMLFLR
jgi:hypothetical protein